MMVGTDPASHQFFFGIPFLSNRKDRGFEDCLDGFRQGLAVRRHMVSLCDLSEKTAIVKHVFFS